MIPRVLAVLVEATDPDPVATADVLIEELTQYSPLLAEKPKYCVLTKIDVDKKIKLPPTGSPCRQ